MRRFLFFTLLLAGAVPAAAQAPLADSTVREVVAPGVELLHIVRGAGPWRAQVLRVDWKSGQFAVRSARALDSLAGRETVSRIAERATGRGDDVIAALNADFFDLKSGESVNNQVSGARIWKALPMSGAPGRSMRSARGQFGVTRAGRLVIDRFVFSGILRAGRTFWSLDGVNTMPANGEGLVLWLPEANGRPRADSARIGRQLAVRVVRGSWRDSLMLQVAGRVTAADTASIGAGTALLVAYGTTAPRLDSLARLPRPFAARADWLPSVGAIDELVGGWPVILRDGASMVEQSASREFTGKSNTDVRHPRSFVGFDADTSHLYLVALDGRSPASAGMTLAEAAAFLHELGVAHALNLDGGGSTALVVRGKVVNHPSDAGGERPVANALLLVASPPGQSGKTPR